MQNISFKHLKEKAILLEDIWVRLGAIRVSAVPLLYVCELIAGWRLYGAVC